MVLAREGAAAMGDLRYYADVKADDFATPLAAAQLGAALAAYGDQTRADAMFRRAGEADGAGAADREHAQVWRADYGTARRDAAAVLALAAEAGSKAVDRAALIDEIAARTGADTSRRRRRPGRCWRPRADRPAGRRGLHGERRSRSTARWCGWPRTGTLRAARHPQRLERQRRC